MRTMVSVAEAKALVAANLPSPRRIVLPLAAAAGRVLAEDLAAREDLPRFANSAMDGYAVREAELRGASPERPVELPLAGEIAAGGQAPADWPPGTCLRILTGAPAPAGADGVIPVEETEEAAAGAGETRVRFRADLARTGSNLRPAGEDLKAGAPLLPAGTRLGPAAIAVLAAQGFGELPVNAPPRVAFLATGDELVDVADTPGPGAIRNSNGPLAAAQIGGAGFPFADGGRVGDAPGALRARLAAALADGDVLVTSGGVSMGRYDLVGELLVELGAEWVFHKVAQKPAKPLAFLRLGGKPVFGLPGNPVSGFLATWYYLLPALRRMEGDADPEPRLVGARLTAPLARQAEKFNFVRAWTEWTDEGYAATPRPPHGSHVLGSLARSNSFALVPPGAGTVDAGQEIRVGFF